jgi:regulator of sigma E protease
VETFSFGFGPRLFGFKRGETDFRFSLILFGGYVKMAGEQPTDENIDDPRAFLAKPRWQRLVIAFAGPAMNMVLAIALVTGMYMVEFPKRPDSMQAGMIGFVVPGSPAAKAGLRAGDHIIGIDDKTKPDWDDISLLVVSHANRPLHVQIERDGKDLGVTVTPVLDEQSGLGTAGWRPEGEIEIASIMPDLPAARAGLRKGDILLRADGHQLRSREALQQIIRNSNGKPVEIEYARDGHTATAKVQPIFDKMGGPSRWLIGVIPDFRMVIVRLSLPQALRESIVRNIRGAGIIYQFLSGIIERRMSPRSISGPIGIAQLSGEAAREGTLPFLDLMALVSLNLAIFNLLPIPILDGGVILMLVIEMIMRRDLSLRVRETVFKLGFVFLMAIMAFALYNDISKMLPTG